VKNLPFSPAMRRLIEILCPLVLLVC